MMLDTSKELVAPPKEEKRDKDTAVSLPDEWVKAEPKDDREKKALAHRFTVCMESAIGLAGDVLPRDRKSVFIFSERARMKK